MLTCWLLYWSPPTHMEPTETRLQNQHHLVSPGCPCPHRSMVHTSSRMTCTSSKPQHGIIRSCGSGISWCFRWLFHHCDAVMLILRLIFAIKNAKMIVNRAWTITSKKTKRSGLSMHVMLVMRLFSQVGSLVHMVISPWLLVVNTQKRNHDCGSAANNSGSATTTGGCWWFIMGYDSVEA